MKIKVEALGAYKMLKNPLIVKGINTIVSEFKVDDGKQWNDGSEGSIKISPGELMDLLAFFATPVDVPEPEVNPIGEQNETNGSNYVS